jgi:hypothetical protein
VKEDRPAPVEGLDIHEVEEGLVVYDAAADRVHYLNPSASLVLSLCDGSRTEAEIAEIVRAAWKLDVAPVEDVRGCLVQLRGEGVLRGPS